MYKRTDLSENAKLAVLSAYSNEQGQIMCAITGDYLSRKDIHIDHIIPLKLGGTNTFCNVVPVRKGINLSKGDSSYTPEIQAILLRLAQSKLGIVTDTYRKISKKRSLFSGAVGLEEVDKLLQDVKPTKCWPIDKLKTMVYKFLNAGKKCLDSLAEMLNTTKKSITSKLVSLGLYSEDFLVK